MANADGTYERTITVTADKPGRTVDVAAGHENQPDHVTLGIEQSFPSDPWTWLTVSEAREVADALVEAASVAERVARQ